MTNLKEGTVLHDPLLVGDMSEKQKKTFQRTARNYVESAGCFHLFFNGSYKSSKVIGSQSDRQLTVFT